MPETIATMPPFDLFNIRKDDDNRYVFCDGIAGSEQDRFVRFLREHFGEAFDYDRVIMLILVNANNDRLGIPMLDDWGRMDNISALPFCLEEEGIEVVAFFQRGPIHEMYDQFMRRMQPDNPIWRLLNISVD